MSDRELTPIEIACKNADEKGEGAGYHVHLKWKDGSVLDAPITGYGPNWVKVAEIADNFQVMTADAAISINWAPGEAFASGPRFATLPDKKPAAEMSPGMR